MNIYDKRVKSAETTIKVASIIRLIIDALMALLLAYSCTKNILLQVHEFGIFYILLVVFLFFVDVIFTILWQFSKGIASLHGACYIALGMIFCAIYFGLVFADASTVERIGFDALSVKFPLLHVIGYYFIGLIPFVIYKVGIRKMKKANLYRIRQLMELSGDENEHI